MRNWVLLLVVALGLAGCDRPKNHAPLSWRPEEVALGCPSGDCPAGTGLLIFVRRKSHVNELMHCSATLVSDDSILTNDHCDLTKQANVRGYFFTRIDGRTVFSSVKGSQFKAKGKFSGLQRDLAILSLGHKIDLPPRRISRHVPERMDSLVSFVANRGYFGGYSLDKITCRTKPKMPIYGGGTDEAHTGLALFDCPVIRGNSGAALFTPDNLNDVQVVVNTIWKFNSEGSETSSLFFEEPDFHRSGFAMGERVQCQKIAGQAEPAKLCTDVDFERTMGDPFRAAVTKELQKLNAQSPASSDIVWTTEVFSVYFVKGGMSSPAVILAPKPFCLRGKNGHAQEVKFSYLKLGFMRDGSAVVKLLAEDRMKVAVKGEESANVTLSYKVVPEASSKDFKFKPLERIKYTSLANPDSVARLPNCGANAVEEASALSLKNVSAITVDSPGAD